MSFWRKLLGLSETTPRAASAAFADSDEFSDSEPAPGYERYLIARQVVLLRPKVPYVRWVHKSLRRSPKYARKVPEYVKALSNKPVLSADLFWLRYLFSTPIFTRFAPLLAFKLTNS